MNISIVLSTFNGDEYIVEQLDTLRNQTRLAEEVLISDDASTDDTVQIIEDYIYGISSFSQRKELSNFYEKITQDEYLNNLKQKYLNNRKLIMKKFIKYIIFVFMSIIMFIIILFLLEFI